MSVWMMIVGAALIGLAAFDAAVTTLSTSSAGGPITSRLARSWWSAAHRLARRPTSMLLTSSGPAILVATVTVWLVLLWSGWTLVFAAEPSAVVSSSSRVPTDLWGRAYFAGFTIFTLGIGDQVPVGAVWQLLTVVSTVSGLALTTTAITYLVPVVTAATDRNTQASTIAGLGGQAHRIVLNAADGGSVRYLEPVLLQLTSSLLLTAERHLAYPILHYFHPRDVRTELRLQLPALDDALTLIEHGLTDQVGRPHPAAIDGARAAIGQLLELAHLSPRTSAPPLDLAPLRVALPTVDDRAFATALEPLRGRRERLAAYAAQSGWSRDDGAPLAPQGR